LDESRYEEAAISYAFIIAPLVAKWVSFGEYIDKKCRQGELSTFIAILNENMQENQIKFLKNF